jgi:Arc/MetJ-type ribon-helix-helix transcriptional regulator
MSKVKDRKITVSLAADLAETVDKHVEQHPQETNRSKVIEEALRLWEILREHGEVQKVLAEAMSLYKKERERELYRSYYADLSQGAKAEAEGWRQVGEEAASRRGGLVQKAKRRV